MWADGYQFKYMNDERDWVYPDDVEAEIQKQTAKIKMGCRIKNCITGEITVLDNVNSAYLVMGCGQRTPHNLLKQQRYKPSMRDFRLYPMTVLSFLTLVIWNYQTHIVVSVVTMV